jgi:hypothetical protein
MPLRIWKPLGLMVVAGLTASEWEVTLIDANVFRPDYARLGCKSKRVLSRRERVRQERTSGLGTLAAAT